MQPVEQEAGEQGQDTTQLLWLFILYVVKSASQLRAEPLYLTRSLRRMPRKAKAALQRIPTA